LYSVRHIFGHFEFRATGEEQSISVTYALMTSPQDIWLMKENSIFGLKEEKITIVASLSFFYQELKVERIATGAISKLSDTKLCYISPCTFAVSLQIQ
jgi:hypothetical protein